VGLSRPVMGLLYIYLFTVTIGIPAILPFPRKCDIFRTSCVRKGELEYFKN
jgi:hypothetical protein